MQDGDIGLIAYCGLYCGDCPFREGKLTGLARDLGEELGRARFDRVAKALSEGGDRPVFGSYGEFREVLKALQGMQCLAACRSGGGNPRCPIRRCATGKDLEGCWECDVFEYCAKLTALDAVHGDAVRRNLRVLSIGGKLAFLRGKRHWYARPR